MYAHNISNKNLEKTEKIQGWKNKRIINDLGNKEQENGWIVETDHKGKQNARMQIKSVYDSCR